jgi:hypothetical protein
MKQKENNKNVKEEEILDLKFQDMTTKLKKAKN